MDIKQSALLFLDFQVDVCDAGGKMVSQDADVLQHFMTARNQASRLLEQARAADPKPLIVHAMHVYQPGYPELQGSELSGMESYVIEKNAFIEGSKGAGIVDELAPLDGECLLKKHSLSPFATTELDLILQRHAIATVILAGVVTHYAILATAFAAYDLGYSAIVLQDCCMSGNPDTHRVALDILKPVARVVPSADIIESLVAG